MLALKSFQVNYCTIKLLLLAITDSSNLVSVTRKKEGMKELFACLFKQVIYQSQYYLNIRLFSSWRFFFWLCIDHISLNSYKKIQIISFVSMTYDCYVPDYQIKTYLFNVNCFLQTKLLVCCCFMLGLITTQYIYGLLCLI